MIRTQCTVTLPLLFLPVGLCLYKRNGFLLVFVFESIALKNPGNVFNVVDDGGYIYLLVCRILGWMPRPEKPLLRPVVVNVEDAI